jgi:hypothetical protein
MTSPFVVNPFPAQSSILDAGALATHVLPRYDLPPPLSCRLLQQGDNDIYLVQAGAEHPTSAHLYVLRVYRHGKRTPEEISLAELSRVQKLGDCRTRCPLRPFLPFY